MLKVLIVEDDPMIVEIYQKKFAESGYEVLTADTGEKVLKIAKEEKVDLILLDLILPRMSGFEVVEKLRGEGYDKNIKIIVLSNLSSHEDREKIIGLGADGFLAKSDYSPTQLVSEVHRLYSQFQEQQSNGIKIEEQKNNHDNGGEAAGSGAPKILMIEDENVFIEMFGEKLKQDGYAMTFAQNGAWGVKEALKDNFDLFIIDMVMPAMTGDEMVAKLKMEEKTKNIPIIILSASVDDEASKKVQAMGINGFYIKTQVTPTELSKAVSEILKK